MIANMINCKYLGLSDIDLDFPCEIHFTRFGNNDYTLHHRHHSYEKIIENIKFEDRNAFKVFVCSTEPTSSENRELISNIIENSYQYDLILTWNEEILSACDNSLFLPYGTTWLNKNKNINRDSLGSYVDNMYEFIDKKFNVSFLSTYLIGKSGYNLRKKIWNNKDNIKLSTRFFSSTRYPTNMNGFSNTLHDGFLPNDDKINLFDSMFSISIESSSEKNYFTEKLIDCFLTKTVPIYYGCPNIGDFFDERGMIVFSTEQEFFEKINKINQDTYDNMKPYIESNYEKAKMYAGNFSERIKEKILQYIDDINRDTSSDILWTIGILTIPERENKLNNLISHIKHITPFTFKDKIEIIVSIDNMVKTVGQKRNEVLSNAKGKYICFIDDDDLVSNMYIHNICLKLNKNIYDAIGFYGIFYNNGNKQLLFHHANSNGGHYLKNNIQYRPLNHLNPVRTEIARTIGFPLKNFSEDTEYCDRLFESNLIKTEFVFDAVMYHYLWSPTETKTQK